MRGDDTHSRNFALAIDAKTLRAETGRLPLMRDNAVVSVALRTTIRPDAGARRRVVEGEALARYRALDAVLMMRPEAREAGAIGRRSGPVSRAHIARPGSGGSPRVKIIINRTTGK